MRSHVVVVSTGGTIATRHDPEKNGDVPVVSGADLVAAVPALHGIGEVEVVEFANIPSAQMTPGIMGRLCGVIESIRSRGDVDGVVVTHGTDTLEETAFFLDLCLAPGKPVCFTGAMRSADHPAPDGPHNLLCAVKCAASRALRGYGVLVVLNGEIHAARYVTKMHTSNVTAFASPFWGPAGHVDEGVILARPPLVRGAPFSPEKFAECVPILKAYTGMDAILPDALAAIRPDGLVLEGFGRGNFPPGIVAPLKRLLDKGVPVVAATRVPVGRTAGIYAADGGGAHLQSLGVLQSGFLNSQKARLLLMLALGDSRDARALADCFKEIEVLPEQSASVFIA